ncbi:MAG TPA: serine hydrolase, partial [Thermoplasmataceae archaeon]|nr:serine hydrolase [Thermoplasmataceae archaeon]
MLDKEQIAAIRSNLEKFILENYGKSSRGIGVSVSQGNDTIVEYAHGEIDELNFRYSINTIYDLASLTKPLVTALLTMRLLERGKIALE